MAQYWRSFVAVVIIVFGGLGVGDVLSPSSLRWCETLVRTAVAQTSAAAAQACKLTPQAPLYSPKTEPSVTNRYLALTPPKLSQCPHVTNEGNYISNQFTISYNRTIPAKSTSPRELVVLDYLRLNLEAAYPVDLPKGQCVDYSKLVQCVALKSQALEDSVQKHGGFPKDDAPSRQELVARRLPTDKNFMQEQVRKCFAEASFSCAAPANACPPPPTGDPIDLRLPCAVLANTCGWKDFSPRYDCLVNPLGEAFGGGDLGVLYEACGCPPPGGTFRDTTRECPCGVYVDSLTQTPRCFACDENGDRRPPYCPCPSPVKSYVPPGCIANPSCPDTTFAP